jgi:hypothetical protein
MTTLDEARAVALALPEVATQDHHGIDSFRVRGKIFASVPDDDHIRVMVAEDDTNAAVAEYPEVCAPFYWGTRLACVVVTLASASPELVRELLTEAWRRKAPKKLLAELDGRG